MEDKPVNTNPEHSLSSSPEPSLHRPSSGEPIPVIRVLSVRGVEYAMMTIALWAVAASLAWVLLNVLNGSGKFNFLVVPLSVLITSLPFFALLFIRLKRAEIANPALRLEPSKRRLSQITQIVAFVAVLINITVFVYDVMQKINHTPGQSIGKSALNLLVILVVAGGILVYYWLDEHRAKR